MSYCFKRFRTDSFLTTVAGQTTVSTDNDNGQVLQWGMTKQWNQEQKQC